MNKKTAIIVMVQAECIVKNINDTLTENYLWEYKLGEFYCNGYPASVCNMKDDGYNIYNKGERNGT